MYVDGTKVQANASQDSLKPYFYVEAHQLNLQEGVRNLLTRREREAMSVAAIFRTLLPS